MRQDSGEDFIVQVEVGFMHTCAMYVDGVVYCWGYMGQSNNLVEDIVRVMTTNIDVSQVNSIRSASSYMCILYGERYTRCFGYGTSVISDRQIDLVPVNSNCGWGTTSNGVNCNIRVLEVAIGGGIGDPGDQKRRFCAIMEYKNAKFTRSSPVCVNTDPLIETVTSFETQWEAAQTIPLLSNAISLSPTSQVCAEGLLLFFFFVRPPVVCNLYFWSISLLLLQFGGFWTVFPNAFILRPCFPCSYTFFSH
jgi:Regulator of chromosome condensation (RCC1) repeat